MTSDNASPPQDLLWGIDLGGTKIEGIVIPAAGDPVPLLRQRIDTESNRGYHHIISRVVELVGAMKSELGMAPDRIGIGHPGVVDPQTGLMKNSNTTALNGTPLRKDLAEALGVPLNMENDANCFALAETLFGAARGANVVFGVIMGTGVGGGIVVNGRALYGCQGIAGEWGHNILIDNGESCYCGKRGCVETVISGPALSRYYAKLAGQELAFRDIAAAAQRGDPNAARTVERLVQYFGRAIAAVINILDPDVVVLGGGISNTPELYQQGVAETRRYVFNNRLETKIVPNQLGDSAGVFGAALLAA